MAGLNLSDLTGGQLVALFTALLTFLNLLFSGRAWSVGRQAKRKLEGLITGIGHPDPRKTSASEGETLTQKVESLTDIMRILVNNDLERRVRADTRGPGRRRYDDASNDE